jgi:hypothetical protein
MSAMYQPSVTNTIEEDLFVDNLNPESANAGT